jgi:hypothetical protein
MSVLLPCLKITYYGEETLQHTWWFTSLSYRTETVAGLLSSAEWVVQWYSITGFAFPFVFMFLGWKKKYSFDVGVAAFALFLGWMMLPALITPMSMGGGWDTITTEAMIGSYAAAISLAGYGVARAFLQKEIGSLEADRFPPAEKLSHSDILVRSVIIVLSFASLILPFAAEYTIHHFGTDTEASLSSVYHWFGGIGEYNMPLWYLLILPIIYLPIIMMCLGWKRTRLFNNGVILLIIYWVWHLLFFVQPFYRAELGSYEQITVPFMGVIFFPIIMLIYTLSYAITHLNRRHEMESPDSQVPK